MHKERIQELINLMETVSDDTFDINQWVHSCGSPSCVAGWATTLPSWKDNGGEMKTGWPVFNDYEGSHAFAVWADIDIDDAAAICGTDGMAGRRFYDVNEYYDVEQDAYITSDITPKNVVKALTKFMEQWG